MQPVGLLLLAAGASTRLGQPKQLLPYHERTLLRHAAEIAAASGCQPLVLVTGALHEELLPEVAGQPFEIIRNEAWTEGMSSSIRVGMAALKKLTAPENPLLAVLLMLCDQPLLTADHLRQLLARQRATGVLAVASAYAGTLGVPVVFGAPLFTQLSKLTGTKGAGPLLASLRPEEVERVDFPDGVMDVDTAEEYQQLLNHGS